MMKINRRNCIRLVLLFFGASSCLILFKLAFPNQRLPISSFGIAFNSTELAPSEAPSSPKEKINEYELERVLRDASMKDKTVIITTLNDAWAEPNSVFDLFLESFKIGDGTKRLRKHLVVVCFDRKAYARCLNLHLHCYALDTNGTNFADQANYMTPKYFDMMWRRLLFLSSVLQLGYNFVFSDTDIMWVRDPFPIFYQDAHFQIACDKFLGNSYDVNNLPNAGFKYIKSTNSTINFYKFWYSSRETYPGLNEQDVLNKIKFDPFLKRIGLEIRFLDTTYVSGFCEMSKDFSKVCTMHANCCIGLEKKVKDLKLLLTDWKRYSSSLWIVKKFKLFRWSVPKYCTW